ncbi:hypothetical protein [Pantoea sp. At-9b]|jgi:hypothetical protein|uniref:hypothetical protein n=1 Tax=Pantoea sp. (strain At-9b) TaxID=592316 RepID=UPI0001B3FDFA|nr:hypothetical protein [Pantoea sp. At-9b]ADU72188.1 hypothetical protein Pat9b_4878 [Pantoea sp. At-9b]
MPENYHNENRMIIGEAAVHLAINNADITVDPLIRELADMVAAEEDPACCVQSKRGKALAQRV